MIYSKSLSKYYHQWLRDAYDSIDYCLATGNAKLASRYQADAKAIFELINANWDAIEFFSVDDRAFLYDAALPIEYRGYK